MENIDGETISVVLCFIVIGGLMIIAIVDNAIQKNKRKFMKRSIAQYRKIK